jgi:hypothetical protein
MNTISSEDRPHILLATLNPFSSCVVARDLSSLLLLLLPQADLFAHHPHGPIKQMAKMKTFNLVLLLIGLLLATTPVSAFWRLLCHGQVGVVRVDPLADFGMISDHAHAVHGANSM